MNATQLTEARGDKDDPGHLWLCRCQLMGAVHGVLLACAVSRCNTLDSVRNLERLACIASIPNVALQLCLTSGDACVRRVQHNMSLSALRSCGIICILLDWQLQQV